jgi:hypothetical protein
MFVLVRVYICSISDVQAWPGLAGPGSGLKLCKPEPQAL